jgi:hypothetical protein
MYEFLVYTPLRKKYGRKMEIVYAGAECCGWHLLLNLLSTQLEGKRVDAIACD